MKKFIALLTFTAVLCSFASCGNDVADEVSEESSVSSFSEEITEEVTTEEVTEETTEETVESETDEITEEEISETENTDEPSENLSADGSYEEAIEKLLECMNNKDVEGMIKLTIPDRYYNVFELMAEMNGVSLDEYTNEMYDTSNESIRLVEIISEEPLDEYYTEAINEMYGGLQVISDYIEENGSENIDYEELEKYMSDIGDISEIKPYFEIGDGYIVNCKFESENENGEKDTYEQELIMYYIDGEGWKTDLSMMGYVKKSKQTSINSITATIYKAANSALVTLDEQGVEIPDCIISSDTGKNYNVSDDFISQLEKELENFFPEYKDYDYFMIIKDGVSTYAAAISHDDSKFIGTYPANKIYSADNDYIERDENMTYDEIYNTCLEQIK
ncbi:MAG: hypothetical protein J6B74_00215 [Ruminococcus sp.]|nr:hypothetical protein [Ruminococcus sp.]